MKSSAGMGIGAAAERFGLAAHVLRLVRRRDDLLRRIAEARASLELIECALECEHEDFTRCAHFQSVIAERAGLPAPRPYGEIPAAPEPRGLP